MAACLAFQPKKGRQSEFFQYVWTCSDAVPELLHTPGGCLLTYRTQGQMVKREGAPQTWKPPGMRTCAPILQVPGSLVGELRLVMALIAFPQTI